MSVHTISSSAEPDVAVILEQLRAEVRAVRAVQVAGEDGTALSAIERELQHCVEQLEIARVVSAHWPLEGRSPYERVWALINKVVRRALRWYINPIVEQQNAFNDVAARSLRLLIETHAELRDQIAELQRRELTPPPTPPLPREAAAAADPGNLQQLVEQQAGTETPAALSDLALRPLPALLGERATVSAHWPLVDARPFGRARTLVKQGLRRYLRWLINPIVEQQNSANAALSAAVAPLSAADGELHARLASLRARR